MKKNKFLAVILAVAGGRRRRRRHHLRRGKDANDTEAPSAVSTAASASDTEAVKDETVYVMTCCRRQHAENSGQRLDQERSARRGPEGHREPERRPAGEGRLHGPGTIQKELPVSMSIHYTLDGKTVTPASWRARAAR